MGSAESFDHRFDFSYGESYEHLVVPASLLESAPEGPGLYSWHFRLPMRRPERAAAFLQSLFHDATLSVRAVGNMRQEWQGEIGASINAFEGDLSPALRHALFAIGYPLYIGISRSLRRRLLTHRTQLEFYKERDPTAVGERGEDDDVESRFFGQRLGSVFSRARFYDADRLYVKCVPWPIRPDGHPEGAADIEQVMAELRSAEWACNTLFHPVFGRR